MNSIYTGLQAGMAAARRVYDDPTSAQQQSDFKQRQQAYALLWAYYNNSIFEKFAAPIWQQYKSNYNLYRNVRSIYNSTTRLVEFYAGTVYPGVLSEDGKALPDGIPLAIPFSEDTPPAVKSAVAQFWQWSDWQSNMSLMLTYGAALGSTLVEVIDDLEHRKVTANIPWPGHICDLDIDAAGHVKAYVLEYPVCDVDEGTYSYRKEVDGQVIRYYRNGELYDYGNGAEVENIYGFVPAVWVRHSNGGTVFGRPAIAGSLNKLDELNNLTSHIHDQIHKIVGAPSVLWSDSRISNLFGTAKRGATNEFDEPASDQESVLMLQGGSGGRVESLVGSLDFAGVSKFVADLRTEIERDHPELTLYEQLRAMSQVTGPAAQRLVGDVASRVTKTAATYDAQSIKLFQMALAIGGMRANDGAWGTLNRQQAKFTPFSLESYAAGGLDMSIMPRPLLSPTKLETAMEKQAVWTGVKLATDAGIPLPLALKQEGWTDQELQELEEATDKEAKAQQASIERQQFLSQADTIPEQEQ